MCGRNYFSKFVPIEQQQKKKSLTRIYPDLLIKDFILQYNIPNTALTQIFFLKRYLKVQGKLA